MARSKKVDAEIVETALDTPQASEALQTLQQQGNALINHVALQLEQTEYSRSAAIIRVRSLMGQASLVMYELGQALVWMRSNEPEQEFVACLNELGLERRLANRFMQAARKFGNALNDDQRNSLMRVNRSKLLELVTLDDDALQGIADGTSDMLDLDEIEAMSVSELRTKLRQEREQRAVEADVKQKRIDAKSLQIDKLESELERLQHGTKDERARAKLAAERHAVEQLQGATLALLTQIESFDVAIGDALANADASPALREHAHSTLSWLFKKLADISIEREMPVDFAEVANPEWLRNLAAQG